MISKQEFLQWKENPVTEEVFNTIAQRIEDAKDVLSVSAGNDSLNDRFLAGMIQAYREILDTSYED